MIPREHTLTDEQVRHAGRIARRRQAEAERQKLQGQHGGHTTGAKSLRDHFLGMLGEVAVAVIMGHPLPDTVNTFKAPDLPGDVQVRTRSKHYYELLVRPVDDDDDIFVHATAEDRELVLVHGWMFGREAKRPQWLKAHGGREPAYFADVKALHHLNGIMPRREVELVTADMLNW